MVGDWWIAEMRRVRTVTSAQRHIDSKAHVRENGAGGVPAVLRPNHARTPYIRHHHNPRLGTRPARRWRG